MQKIPEKKRRVLQINHQSSRFFIEILASRLRFKDVNYGAPCGELSLSKKMIPFIFDLSKKVALYPIYRSLPKG